MKLRIFFCGRTILIMCMLISHITDVSSQIISAERWKQPGFFFGVSAGITYAPIINKETEFESIVVTSRKVGGLGSIETGYFFSRYLGLTSGISFNKFSSNLYIDSYQNRYYTIDRENEPYELQVSGYGIEEIQYIDILSIPLLINFRTPLNKEIGVFLQAGINFQIPIENAYRSSGIVTQKGYFPAYNVLLENLPEYGFSSDLKIDSEGKLELNQLNYCAATSIGIDYLIQKRVQVTFAAYYDRSLTDVTKYSSINEFHLITEEGNFNSLLSVSNRIALQTLAFKLSLRYFISDYSKFKYYYRPSSRQNQRTFNRQKRIGF